MMAARAYKLCIALGVIKLHGPGLLDLLSSALDQQP